MDEWMNVAQRAYLQRRGRRGRNTLRKTARRKDGRREGKKEGRKEGRIML